jgi:hypothetical protein
VCILYVKFVTCTALTRVRVIPSTHYCFDTIAVTNWAASPKVKRWSGAHGYHSDNDDDDDDDSNSSNNNNSITFHRSQKKTLLAKDMKHVNEIKHDYNKQLVITYNRVPLLHKAAGTDESTNEPSRLQTRYCLLSVLCT